MKSRKEGYSPNRGKPEWFRQCKMEKWINEEVRKILVSWIPEKYAKKGKFLKLKNYYGDVEDGWKVIEVYKRKPFHDIKYYETQDKYWRNVTDV